MLVAPVCESNRTSEFWAEVAILCIEQTVVQQNDMYNQNVRGVACLIV
jgi:hypothetical protein